MLVEGHIFIENLIGMDRKMFLAIVSKHLRGTANPEEEAFLHQYYRLFMQDPAITSALSDIEKKQLKDRIKNKIDRERFRYDTLHRKSYRWYYAAAAVLFLALAFTLYWIPLTQKPVTTTESAYQTEIAPGGNRATLTWADGQSIHLSTSHNGITVDKHITYLDGTSVLGDENDLSSHSSRSIPQDLVLSTPKGGTYQVILPDGTAVWLNAASQLRYPSYFNGKERVVQLEGEAYFEVTRYRNAQGDFLPFIVQSSQQRVRVLGTQFNVSAYPEEKDITTTLLTGQVQVERFGDEADSATPSTALLQPGQQAILRNHIFHVQNEPDLEKITSWKDGYFKFNENLESILTKVARWYNVEIDYRYRPPSDVTFSGKISRDKKLSTVLNIIGYQGNVHFQVEGRRVIVMK